MSAQDEWIGVAEVAAELKLSERAAWELVRRLGVPRIEPGREVLRMARFRRSAWEAARDAATRPPEPRHRRAAPTAHVVAPRPRPATPWRSQLEDP